MAEYIATPVSDEESLRLLREFLRQVEKMLADLDEYPRPAIPGRHHESMKAAWTAVRPSFNTAVNDLQMTIAASGDVLSRLKDSGLTGHQLVFKLSIFRHASDRLIDHGTPKDGQQRKRRWWSRWRRLFKPVLKAADVILGSLADILPVLEAIKEYKEAVESGVELGEAVR
jgi:hypothetical protein